MPFKTPEYVGEKDALEYLGAYPRVAKDIFVNEGTECAKLEYKEETRQKGYLQGWVKVWPEKANIDPATQNILNEINKGLNSYEGDQEPFDILLEEKREFLRKDGWYLYYDPNANDMEGEYKVAPLAQLQEAK